MEGAGGDVDVHGLPGPGGVGRDQAGSSCESRSMQGVGWSWRASMMALGHGTR